MTITIRKTHNDLADLSKTFSDSWSCKLPFELWEQIFEEAWKAPMSIPERSQFEFAIENASPFLSDILKRIMARDVYVPWNSQQVSFKDVFPTPGSLRRSIRHFELCRSFTREIMLSERPPTILQARMSQLQNLRGRPMRDVLFSFRGIPFLRNLQRFAIQYHAPSFSRQFLHIPFVHHQFEVARLTIQLNKVTSWMMDMLESPLTGPQDDFMLARRPSMELISATSDDAVTDILHLCPHLELLDDAKDISVRIVESSRPIDDGSTLIHGPLHSRVTWYPLEEQLKHESTMNILGVCLALIIPTRNTCGGNQMGKSERKPYMLVRHYGQ